MAGGTAAEAQTVAPMPVSGEPATAIPTVRVQFGTPTAPGATLAPIGNAAGVCAPSANGGYNAAVNAMSTGNDALAVAMLDRVLSECPAHPHAAELRRLASLRAMRGPSGDAPRPSDAAPPSNNPFGPESVATLSRAEAVTVQVTSGIGLGALVCGAANCNDGRYYVATSLLGGVAGFVSSYLATGAGITPGQSVALSSGTYWGYINGGLLLGALSGGRSISAQAATGFFMGGAAVGTAVGAVVAGVVRPPAYRVSMANSGGVWLSMFTLGVTLLAVDATRPSITGVLVPQMIAANLGFIGGLVLGAYVPISRSRMWLIDLAGIIGSGTGFALGLLIPNPSSSGSYFSPSVAIMGAGLLIGEVGGLALGYYLTRHWDGSHSAGSVQTAFMPVGPSGGPGLTVGLTL